MAVPDKIEVKISNLDVGQAISAADVVLPEGAELAEAGTTPIVSCNEKSAQEEEEVEEAAPAAEPAE